MSSSIDLLNLAIALIGIFVGILIGAHGRRHDRQLVRESGGFRKSKLKLSLFGSDLNDVNFAKPTTWLLVHPGSSGDIAFFPLRFAITNTGDATCDKPVLIIQTPEACIPHQMPEENLKLEVVPGVYKQLFTRSVGVQGNFAQLSYMYERVDPMMSAVITDLFTFQPGVLVPLSVEATTADGINLKVPVTLSVTCDFALTVLNRDSPPVQISLSIGCIAGESLDDAVQRYVEAVRRSHKELLAKLSHTRRLFRILSTPRETRRVVFLFFDVESVSEAYGRRLYVMKELNDGAIGKEVTISDPA